MKQRTRIKICGVCDPDQISEFVQLGVDAIGLVFAPNSPRCLAPGLAAEVAAACPPFMARVGLFRNASVDSVNQVLAEVPLDLLQFHGSESNAFARQFERPFIRAVGLGGGRSTEESPSQFPDARALLLDSHAPGAAGGSGKAGNWVETRQWAQTHGLKYWILAGGLDPDNVGEAIRQAQPFGVDVSSGVEDAPGRKAMARVRAFVAAVRESERTC